MLVERLCRLVSLRSLSREEGAIAYAVAAELAAAGLSVQRAGHNVWCELGDAPRPRLLLNSHLDTVPPAAGWPGDPWTPQREGGRIVGLGANDAKGCVAAMMQAALDAHARLAAGGRLGGTLVLALTVEEEIAGAGLCELVERLRPIDAALVGEPTDLTPMTAQRGLLIVRGVAGGVARHPANTPPDYAENAILKAAADLLRLREFDWGATHPLLGRAHAHVTMIGGGTARNVIPASCEFWLDIRTTPLESHAALFERLSRHLSSELHVHSQRLVPIQTDERERIVQAVLRALPGQRPAGSPAMSDMVWLAGVPAVKIGPGSSPRSHTAGEYILESELAAGAAAYWRIVAEYFGDG